ncbi:MAG: glycosyltransferase family 4 protein, partial [Actinobacteria bacterium]|nr:glycosyltransferase family 4 protein [Actinomycetota bacterium]
MISGGNHAGSDLDFYIYHRWPPGFNPPATGYFIMMQPWEFGSLPREWISPFNDMVDDVWVYSNYLKDTYISSGINPDKISVIHPYIDTAVFNRNVEKAELDTNKKFKFLFVGGTIHRKGIDILLNSYFSAFTAKDDVCLVIKDICTNSAYANQTLSEEIKKFASGHELAEVLYIQDEYRNENEMASLYNACDCLVHPYRAEGFGLPVAEAMACGIPVIVTNHGACMDFCNPSNAFLIANTIEKITEKKIGDIETVDYPFWSEPDTADLKRKMMHVYDNYEEAKVKAESAYENIRQK